ncbi:MAG: hypothetical protein KJ607_00085, partial [Bacteroidetes bacterium]|nr:hypothetical protein [Bacteroidota bacterium]
ENIELIITAYKALSAVYEAQNNHQAALECYKSYTSFKDSLWDVQKNRQMAEMEAKYQAEKKDKEILSQRTVILQKETEIEHTKILRNSMIICFILVLIIIFIFFRYRFSLFRKNEEIRVRNALIEGEQNERSRISQELHDALGSELSTVMILMNNCRNKENFDIEIFSKGIDKLKETQSLLRRISRNIMPRVMKEYGLKEALSDLFDDYNSFASFKVKYQFLGQENRVDSIIEFNLYRVIQEIMQNIVKHSYATEVFIELSQKTSGLRLVVEDNGRGFDSDLSAKSSGSGVTNIKHRVEFLHGKTNIESLRDAGTTYEIQIPLRA